jgi:glutaconate CoA-transferase subunit B
MSAQPWRREELLAAAILRRIGPARHVAVGAQSPIPATAALLARQLGGGRPLVSLLSSERHNPFTDGARELFDCAGQGRVDVFFLSGGQIDGTANINLNVVGDYARPEARFPGAFGSAYLYFVVPRVILFRTEHSRRSLVPRVDFVTAPGVSAPGVYRPGGPVALVTNRCVFDFDRGRARFRLASLHPGHTMDEIRENTGFDFDCPAEVAETEPPSTALLVTMREVVAPLVGEIYPQFAAKVFGITTPAPSPLGEREGPNAPAMGG